MPEPEPPDRLARLTPKEREILLLVADALSSKEIAARLGIAKTSVDTYCNRARAKLGVKDRYEAARLLAVPERAPRGAPAMDVATVAVPAATAAMIDAAMPEPAPPAPILSKRSLVVLAVATGIIVALAVGSLMSGVKALEELQPPASKGRHRDVVMPQRPDWGR